ncbi:MAG TPA: RluA family pseudouridine synthase [Polyangiaceae bacterium]|nr:RluA family pseudouridine synthase [Polyangiaceae bacterium]
MSPRETVLVVPREDRGARLDRFVARALGVSRTELKRWIEGGYVTVEGAARAPSARLREGDRVAVIASPSRMSEAFPEPNVVFEVLHVDDEVVVVMKPAGLVVHPGHGHKSGTLVNGLLGLGLFRANEDVASDDVDWHLRPGIVHRLDKGTSGVMVVARTPHARETLKAQFQSHSIERSYEAIAVGRVQSGTFATLHGRHPHDRLRFTTRVSKGKRAVTHVRAIELFDGATHVECTLETGRTHQIRVHLAENATPVLGDPLYGSATPSTAAVDRAAKHLGHQALHARVLGFSHPRTGQRLRFEAPAPADFVEALLALRRG